jgi:hypothetical protein
MWIKFHKFWSNLQKGKNTIFSRLQTPAAFRVETKILFIFLQHAKM